MPNVKFTLVPVDYSRPYEEQPECKRHVIGAYANLARHNMTLTINTIMQAIGMPLFNENEIENAFSKSHRMELDTLDSTQKLNLQKRFYRHFPFFKRLKLEDEKKKSVQLGKLLGIMSDLTECMTMLRNTYTHYHPYVAPNKAVQQLELKKRIGKLIDQLFENSTRIYKKGEKIPHEGNELFTSQRKLTKKEIIILRNSDSSFDETLKTVQTEIEKRKKNYQTELKKRQELIAKGIKPNKELEPVSETEVHIGKDTYIVGSNGTSIKKIWNQYDRDPDYYARMCDDEKGLSDAGIVYFICLFLDKQVASDFMDEVGFTEQCYFSESNIIMLKELMSLNRIRMVKMRLDSEMNETALALDMMSELRKCPQPLYDVLDTSARNDFKDATTVKWEMEHQQEATVSYNQQEDEDNEFAPQKSTPRSTFVRWDDRFSELALQYIDRWKPFNDIRFHLNLGKYRFAFYNHTSEQSVDGRERLRILQKELHGFGRIQEVEAVLKERWKKNFDQKEVEDGLIKKKPDTEGQAPYVTEQRPRYNIDKKSNSIGLRWEGWDNGGNQTVKRKDGTVFTTGHYGDLAEKKMFIPNIPRPASTDPTKHENKAERLLQPQCMLNLFDLPALVFHRYLLEKYRKDVSLTEQIIKGCYNSMHSFLTDLSKGTIFPLEHYQIKVTDIPDRIRQLLEGKRLDNVERLKESAMRKLKERKARIERTQKSYYEKKDRIGNKDNKFDKMRATIKTGQLGRWLMQDIMDWIPQHSEARQKLTGQTYMVLQSSLTLLGQKINEDSLSTTITLKKLKVMMVNAKIVEEDIVGNKTDALIYHPFLHLVFSECYDDSVEAFYEKYLEKELNRIQQMIDWISKPVSNDAILGRYRYTPFIHHERTRWKPANSETLKLLATRYLERPLQLPKGLFTDSIRVLLNEIALENGLTADKVNLFANAVNAAQMISLYHTLIEGDDSQRFYHNEPTKIGTIKNPNAYGHLYRLFKKLYGNPNENSNRIYKFSTPEINRILTGKIDAITSTNQLLKIKRLDYKIYEYIIKEMKKEGTLKPIDVHLIVLDRKYADLNDYEEATTVQERLAIDKLLKEILKKLKNYEIDMIWEYYMKMKRMAKKVASNERAILRYKTQDVLLLYMARNILMAKSNNAESFKEGFMLENVRQGDALLDKTINFEWKVMIVSGTPDLEEKQQCSKTIVQNNMKMKNYGQFYKFASDHQRLSSLLSRLPDDIFQRAEIENEFAYYDTNRSEVFRQVYIIESKAYKLKPELTDDANAYKEWFTFIDKKSGKPRAKRNNFGELLKILAAGGDGVLDDVEKSLLQSTRNAFGHNTYDVDMQVVFNGKQDKMKVPEVANGIKEKILEQTEELKKNV